MIVQEIKTPSGQLIGRIEDRGYAFEARNKQGMLLASYTKSNNVTRNRQGKIVATGNILSSYITGEII